MRSIFMKMIFFDSGKRRFYHKIFRKVIRKISNTVLHIKQKLKNFFVLLFGDFQDIESRTEKEESALDPLLICLKTRNIQVDRIDTIPNRR